MSRYRRAAKVDDNQSEIVTALREIPGVTVQPGHDDILVGYRGRTFWFEIKTKMAIRLKACLKPSQAKLLAEWTGHYRVVSCLEDIMSELKAAVGACRHAK